MYTVHAFIRHTVHVNSLRSRCHVVVAAAVDVAAAVAVDVKTIDGKTSKTRGTDAMLLFNFAADAAAVADAADAVAAAAAAEGVMKAAS